MHGLGNDFVLCDGIDSPPAFSPPALRALAHRREGIGFDQLLLLLPAQDGDSDFYCRIFNSDGGEVGQCGNGVRCAHAFLRRRQRTAKKRLVLATTTTRLVTEEQDSGEVRVEMPPATILPQQQAHGHSFHHITVGNPHYVCLDGGGVGDDDLIAIGARLNEEVAGGVNVGFAEVRDADIHLRVYERGAGYTAACGSGALAAAIAAIGAARAPNPVTVHMPGGTLKCGIAADNRVWLQGGVTHVFDGVLPPMKT